MADGPQILLAGVLMAAALLSSLLANRLQLPSLLLFLGVGMIAGSEGLGWVEFDDYSLAREIGIVALILILAEGGLSTGFERIRPVLGQALSLATVGTLVTALATGAAAQLLFDFSLLESFLLGAIVASTDAAAIFGVLRGSSLNRRIARTLEGEAGLNDPVAILLVLGFIEWIEDPSYGVVDLTAGLAVKLAIGLLVGLLVGAVAIAAFRRLRLSSPGLYPVISISAAAIAYGSAEAAGGSGFLSVYIAALSLGSAEIPAKRTVAAFHEGLGGSAQVALFLTLGLLVFPSQLPDVAVEGTVLALVLTFIARPLAVWVSTAPFATPARERLILSWAGLRGAVPVVLATFAVTAGVESSLEFFNIVFFSVLLSTLLQGATFEAAARFLGTTSDEPAAPVPLLEVGEIRQLGADVVEHTVMPGDAVAGTLIRDLGLPREALVSLIVRDEAALAPRGSTRLQEGDRLLILVDRRLSSRLRDLAERWRTGPMGA